MQNSSLRQLRLMHGQIYETDAKIIANLIQKSSIVSLGLNWNGIGKDEALTICDLLKNHDLAPQYQ